MTRRLRVALATLAGVLLVFTPAAFGAQVTKTLSFPLSGSSTTNIFSLGPYHCCEVSVFDTDLGDIHDVTLSLDMGTELSSPTHSDLTFTDTNLRQGRTLDLVNTYQRDAGGKLDVSYTLAFHANIYGFVVDPSKTVGDTLDCSVPLLAQHCEHTTSIGLFDITVLDILVGSVKVHFSVPITTKADLTGDGVSSVRTMFAGAPIVGPDTLTFTSDPFAKDESTFLSCSLPANEPVNYAMDTASSEVNGGVTENVGLAVSVVASPAIGPDFTVLGPFDIFSFDLPTKTINPINVSAPGQNVDLGNLLPNNVAPTVAMDTIPSNGKEGAPIQLAIKGTGPGGSLSPCGDEGLDIDWKFDDGGTAFGKVVNHSFPDNLLGVPSPPRTGHVTITDPTGLTKTIDFSVPVANVAPTVGAGPDKTALWGVPVSFHANGSDQGPIDNGSLLFSWDFGDPSSPVGGSGQDTSHIYSMPSGATPYAAAVIVSDKDGATGSDTVQVAVLKRGTTMSYTGPIQSNSSKTLTLSAALVDELGNAVSGAAVVFTLGAQTVTANTSSSGIATATLKLSQKHGAYTVSADFAGSAKYLGSSSSQPFQIGP